MGTLASFYSVPNIMEVEKNICESICMIGGNGPYSYAKNSSYQRAALDVSKAMVNEAIATNLDAKLVISTTPFCIADLGCSVGPNTFIAVQTIIEAVKHKYNSLSSKSSPPEFVVFFNDQASNDFNTLFATLPSDRQYFAVGSPGSFYGRLFPKGSLHFVCSTYTLHWLSSVPKGLGEKNSPAWNKGRIHYSNAPDDVLEAYSIQFAKDMLSFLEARALEVVPEGLMTLVVPAIPNGTLPSHSFICLLKEILGCAVMDMAKKVIQKYVSYLCQIYHQGLVSEEKIDSFNLPIYYPTPMELEMLIQANGSFTIEKTITISNPMKNALYNPKTCNSHVRAGLEQLIKEHFGIGNDVVDEVFSRYTQRIGESTILFEQDTMDSFVEQFVLLKRKVFL